MGGVGIIAMAIRWKKACLRQPGLSGKRFMRSRIIFSLWLSERQQTLLPGYLPITIGLCLHGPDVFPARNR